MIGRHPVFVRETPFVFENRELWLGGKNSNKFKCNAFLLESFWRIIEADGLHLKYITQATHITVSSLSKYAPVGRVVHMAITAGGGRGYRGRELRHTVITDHSSLF